MIKYLFSNRSTITSDKRHWYQIKVFYKNKKGSLEFDFSRKVGLVHQGNILNKKAILSAYNIRELVDKKHLSNGTMYYEVLSYLGHFKE